MLIVGEELLFSKDLLEIIKKFQNQTANELFSDCEPDTYNLITSNYEFHVIAISVDDIKIILSFFDKFKLVDNQKIVLKFMNIKIEDIGSIFEEYKDHNVINRLFMDISYDKSRDFINIIEFYQMRIIINEVKSIIPRDASNLEIITYVYNWLKRREYKHDEKNPMLSKHYSSALITEYIVCVGFSKVFNNILSEYGICASEYKYNRLVGGGEVYGHDISIVKVQDEKYAVDGLYFFDLTRDCFDAKNDNSAKYSGFMMTYDEVSSEKIESDMLNKMLLLDAYDLEETINMLKPEVDKLTIEDDDFISDDFNQEILQLIFNLMQLDDDLFTGAKTVDLAFISNPYGAMYYINSYILFLKNRLGRRVKQSTIIDLLINTVKNQDTGYYLFSACTYSSLNTSNSLNLENSHQYIKKRLGTNSN